jgi:autotransporter-associated beta strand protein
LRNSNVYQGVTTVQQGTLIVGDPLALGTTSAGTMVTQDGTLELRFSVAAEPLVAQDDGNGHIMTCFAAAALEWGGPISIGGTVGFFAPPGCDLRLTGTISGPGNLSARPAGPSIVELGAINTYTGSTTMDTGGELRLGISNAIPDGSVVTINGRFNLSSHSDAVAGLNATEGSLIELGTGTLTLIPPQGAVTQCLAPISGDGNLMKQGAGVARLAASNTFTGLTTVAAGTLLLDGRLTGSVVVTGGTLAGDGAINGSLTANGGARVAEPWEHWDRAGRRDGDPRRGTGRDECRIHARDRDQRADRRHAARSIAGVRDDA